MSAELTFDPSVVPSDAWQTILSTETDTDVNNIKVALYTDTVFSTWADANPSEPLASEYSDNVIAMMCTITMFNGNDFVATQTNLDSLYCLVGERLAFGGTMMGNWEEHLSALGADVNAPVVGDRVGTGDIDNFFTGFTTLSVD